MPTQLQETIEHCISVTAASQAAYYDRNNEPAA
jgi:hypothetical protein